MILSQAVLLLLCAVDRASAEDRYLSIFNRTNRIDASIDKEAR